MPWSWNAVLLPSRPRPKSPSIVIVRVSRKRRSLRPVGAVANSRGRIAPGTQWDTTLTPRRGRRGEPDRRPLRGGKTLLDPNPGGWAPPAIGDGPDGTKR